MFNNTICQCSPCAFQDTDALTNEKQASYPPEGIATRTRIVRDPYGKHLLRRISEISHLFRSEAGIVNKFPAFHKPSRCTKAYIRGKQLSSPLSGMPQHLLSLPEHVDKFSIPPPRITGGMCARIKEKKTRTKILPPMLKSLLKTRAECIRLNLYVPLIDRRYMLAETDPYCPRTDEDASQRFPDGPVDRDWHYMHKLCATPPRRGTPGNLRCHPPYRIVAAMNHYEYEAEESSLPLVRYLGPLVSVVLCGLAMEQPNFLLVRGDVQNPRWRGDRIPPEARLSRMRIPKPGHVQEGLWLYFARRVNIPCTCGVIIKGDLKRQFTLHRISCESVAIARLLPSPSAQKYWVLHSTAALKLKKKSKETTSYVQMEWTEAERKKLEGRKEKREQGFEPSTWRLAGLLKDWTENGWGVPPTFTRMDQSSPF